MKALFDEMIRWMLCELILSTGLALIYMVLRKAHPSAHDRYSFLKWGFAAIVLFPWFNIPGLTLLIDKLGPSRDSIGNASVLITSPTLQVSSYNPMLWLQWLLIAAYVPALIVRTSKLAMEIVSLRRRVGKGRPLGKFEGIPIIGIQTSGSPFATGIFRPKIVFPLLLWDALDPVEIDMICRHEKCHIERQDPLANLAKSIVQCILLFSPFLPYLAKSFVEEMELSCDDLVLAEEAYEAKRYGQLLFKVASLRPNAVKEAEALVFVSHSFLSRRIAHMLEKNHVSSKAIYRGSLVLFLVLGAGVISVFDLGSTSLAQTISKSRVQERLAGLARSAGSHFYANGIGAKTIYINEKTQTITLDLQDPVSDIVYRSQEVKVSDPARFRSIMATIWSGGMFPAESIAWFNDVQLQPALEENINP